MNSELLSLVVIDFSAVFIVFVLIYTGIKILYYATNWNNKKSPPSSAAVPNTIAQKSNQQSTINQAQVAAITAAITCYLGHSRFSISKISRTAWGQAAKRDHMHNNLNHCSSWSKK